MSIFDYGFCNYDFFYYDKYAKDQFNPDFVNITKIDRQFDLITVLEVFEHLENPLTDLREVINYTENLIFTTQIIPNGINKVSEWWYFSPLTGQHITFYTHNSLAKLAKYFNMHYVGTNLIHIFSKQPIDVNLVKEAFIIKDESYSKARHSLLQVDYNRLLNQKYNLNSEQ